MTPSARNPPATALPVAWAAIGVRGRTTREAALRHPVRRRLLDLIRRLPGVRMSTLWRHLHSHRGTIQYHLAVLERVHTVEAVRTKRLTRYFPADLGPEDREVFSLLWRGRLMEVARAIVDNPGIAQVQVLRRLGLRRKAFRRYADLLLEKQLLHEIRGRNFRLYFPTPRLAFMVDQLDTGQELGKTEMGGRVPGGEV